MDRAALDFAIHCDIEHGGWCPKNRRAEDGPLAEHYRLTQTESSSYAVRTRLNVRDSDATLVLHADPMGRGTALTLKILRQSHHPHLRITLPSENEATPSSPPPASAHDASLIAPEPPMDGDSFVAHTAPRIVRWLDHHRPQTLNVAGSRETSHSPVYSITWDLLAAVWQSV